MCWQQLLLAIGISATAVSAGRSLQHVGRKDPGRAPPIARGDRENLAQYHDVSRRAGTGSTFMNANTSSQWGMPVQGLTHDPAHWAH